MPFLSSKISANDFEVEARNRYDYFRQTSSEPEINGIDTSFRREDKADRCWEMSDLVVISGLTGRFVRKLFE
ncbi:hypothetical protein CEXT_291861 [Caerostris extrusa]|uniref:Uncharacterized protein n=1 Tax=Caerostris extrusa TaxID=172846 RepID=A0AAV4YEK1_CAEEX|nr:hypothetical protein CEXT_291861 [Caerostris extrusa]